MTCRQTDVGIVGVSITGPFWLTEHGAFRIQKSPALAGDATAAILQKVLEKTAARVSAVAVNRGGP